MATPMQNVFLVYYIEKQRTKLIGGPMYAMEYGMNKMACCVFLLLL